MVHQTLSEFTENDEIHCVCGGGTHFQVQSGQKRSFVTQNSSILTRWVVENSKLQILEHN